MENGFALYKIEDILRAKDGEVKSQLLAYSKGGPSAILDYSPTNQKLTFQRDVYSICIAPIVDINSVSLMLIPSRKDIWLMKRDDDQVIAMDKNTNIYTWSIASGNLVSFKRTGPKELQGYKPLRNNDLN